MKRFSAAGATRRYARAPRFRSHSAVHWIVTGLFLASILSLLSAMPAAAQGRPPGGNFNDPTIREVDIAQPAVVRIATLYQGSITFDLCGRQDVLPGGGQQLTLGGFGSGAFISANGDILTADHVVDIDKGSLDQEIFAVLAQQIADLLNANASCLNLGGFVTADQVSYTSIHNAGIAFSTSYSAPKFVVWLNSNYTGPVTDGLSSSDDFIKALLAAKHMDATLTGFSQFAENDVALLHVAMTDTPSIPLGNSDTVAVEDHLTIIGFPGNGDASHADSTYDTTDLVTPTVNTLTVSSLKTNDNGDTLIQVSGGIEHGDSGGPAIDSAGHLMGIVSYSGPDDPINNFFLRASNSARTLISTTNVSTTPGTFEKLWRQAFLDYTSTDNGHWHTAAQELDALSTHYPDFQGVLPYKNYADQAAQTEVSLVGAGSNTIVIIALAVALLALVLLIIVLVAMRQRRKQQPAVVPATSTYGSYPYGAYSPYNPYNPYNPYSPYGGPNGTTSGAGNGNYPSGYQAATTPVNPYGYSGYGNYLPQGTYRPTTDQPASSATQSANGANATNGTNAANATSGISSTNDANGANSFNNVATPVQATPLPQSNAGYAGTAYTPREAVPFAMMGQQSATPNSTSYATPSTDESSTTPAPNIDNSSNNSGLGIGQTRCVNGHPMAAGETYCTICGMPRASAEVSQTIKQWPDV